MGKQDGFCGSHRLGRNVILLNLGCGPKHIPLMVNVDNEPLFKPDKHVNLEQFPWPWQDKSVDHILASHIIEHMPKWEKFFSECVRILKPGGQLEIAVPHYHDIVSMTEIGHLHVFTPQTFKNLAEGIPNHWWDGREHLKPPVKFLPIRLEKYEEVANPQKWWMPRWALQWLLGHCLGFGMEQRFYFRKSRQRYIGR